MTKLLGTDFSRPKTPARTGRCALLASIMLVLAACSTYPLGMSKEEWVLLTPEQQLEARMKQSDLNRANAQRRAEQAAARRQRYAAIEAAERRRIEELYKAAHYGDVLECVVEGGTAGVGPGWRAYTPVPFTLARGEIKSVSLSAGGRHGKFWAQYSPDGLSMKLCYGNPRDRGGRFCASVNGQSADFSSGISRRVSVNRVFRDASVVCAYRPELDMPQVYIRRHNPQVYRVIHSYHYQSRPRRTPAVFRRYNYRPAPRHESKTVIHKHYDAPAPQQRARREEQTEPRETYVRGRPQSRPAYRTPRAPEYVAPQEVEAERRASPGPNVPDHARSHVVANPRSAVKKARAVSAQDKKPDQGKIVQELPEGSDKEYLTSAPAPGKKRGWGRTKKDSGTPKKLQETPDYEAWVDDYLTSVETDSDNRGRGRRDRQ